MLGSALSTRTVTEPAAPVFPSRSVWAAAVRFVMPLAVTESVWNGCAAATPEPVSVAVHLTVTSELFQPAALAAGVRAAVTTGPVLSSVYEACVELVWPVQLFALKFGEAATVNACAPLPAGAVV